MSDPMSPQQQYFELYKVALAVTHRQDYSNEIWAEAAHVQALALLQKAKLPTTAAQAPNMPAVLPEGVQNHRFGPAFAGWDENALMQVLVTVQELVLAAEYGGTPDQLNEVRARVNAAIARVGDEHAKMKAEAQAKKAAGG